MKKNKIHYLFLVCTCLIFSSIFVSCEDDDAAQQELPYLFRPINLNAEVRGTEVTLSWSAIDGAVSYTVEIYKDSLQFQAANMVLSETIENRFMITELAGSTLYSARVRANAAEESKDSKFNETLTFKTPTENLFNGYTSRQTSEGTAIINWLPKSNVTKLSFKGVGGNNKDFTISSAEALAGSKVCDGLANDNYTVEIYNNSILRGNMKMSIEGDVFLNAGDDLIAAMNDAKAGSTIVLAKGSVFNVGSGTYRFSKNIKLKGFSASEKSVICMSGSEVTTTSGMLGFVDGSSFDYVRFENIEFSGYTDNNPGAIKIGYIFNNNVKTTLGELSFKNCVIRNLGNTPVRLQGDKNQTINNLTFDGCLIYEIGFASVYAIVNVNTATDLINNITFTNSTIYNFKGSLVLRQKGNVNAVTVSYCTINQGMMDTGSNRYLMDYNTATVGKITIGNTIFGETAPNACGVRPALDNSSVSGCYYTSNYIDNGGGSIVSLMTAYPKSSADLWMNPANGDFKFKDATFAGKATAGDPRWK